MVNKIFCRKLARAWLQTKPEPPQAKEFSEPRCQNYVASWYLVYRCLILLAWIAIDVCSICEIGSYKPRGNRHKWPIYLTNWDLVLGTAQASLALFIVSKRWKLQKLIDYNPSNLNYGKILRVYWFLYTVTCSIALGVTVTYWYAVHDPKIHTIDALNIMLHVCNSILMIFDLCVSKVPLRLRHFWWPLTIVILYIIFTFIYYTAGGLDKLGHRYIYKVLNWQNPGRTLLIWSAGLLFLVVVHCLLCLLTSLRQRLYSSGEKYIRESQTNSSSDQSRQTDKHVEIV